MMFQLVTQSSSVKESPIVESSRFDTVSSNDLVDVEVGGELFVTVGMLVVECGTNDRMDAKQSERNKGEQEALQRDAMVKERQDVHERQHGTNSDKHPQLILELVEGNQWQDTIKVFGNK